MALIRWEEIDNNAGGRVACQVQHHASAGIFYVSLEGGHIVVKDFNKREIGRERDAYTILPLDLSADFEFSYDPNPGRMIVTIGGFPANGNRSAIYTYMIDVRI